MANNVHIVPHMHWDREWYFTTEESRILLVNNMEEIMDRLENDDNYPYFVMDGQTAILEDYFEVKPENKLRVKKLVEQGKMIIGPWYTQTDEMVVGGESIVRNLLYGIKDCNELGEPMMIGYLPDSFGQSEKMPQILNGFGINRSIFWRGCSERFGTTKHNFKWRSNSEGEVTVHLMPLGYAIGKYLPVEQEALKKRMDKYLPVLDSGSVNEDVLLPNGHDQMPIQKDIFEVIDELKKLYPEREFFLSKYENIFDKLEEHDNLDTIQGELLDGKYMRVHRSIFSSRADLKSSNTRIENKITNLLEPLASIAYTLGASYEEGLMESIWKELMKNHAHDSIGCCCSDKVHKAIENRFFLAEDKIDELIRYYMRKITDAMSCEECLDKITAFNFLPYKRTEVIEGNIITKMKNFILEDSEGNVIDYEILEKEVVDAGLIDRQIVHYGNYDPFVRYRVCFKDTLPSMGFKAYLVKNADGDAQLSVIQNQDRTGENEFYKIEIMENGTMNITDKEAGTTYFNVLQIEDGSDDGDEYDYSPLEEDFVVTSSCVNANVEKITSKNKTVFTISFEMKIPKDLESRKQKVIDSVMAVKIKVELKEGTPVIDVQTTINNQSKDHRVRLLIPNNLASKFSVSDNQFGKIKRDIRDSAMDVWEKEQWDERPDSIYPMLSYVGLDNEEGISVLTNSVREYEVVGESNNIIAVTLFRSVGYLGKEELVRRPGRPSGIKMATPDSQMIGEHSFSLALVNNKNVSRYAKEYTTPVITYNKMPYNAMKLNKPDFEVPYQYSLLEMENKNFILSALKKAQGKDGIIMRGYQVNEPNMKTYCHTNNGYKITDEVNLNENSVKEMATEDMLTIQENVVKSYFIKK